MNAAGLVLCGGRSQRMGQAKAWLPMAGELLLQRVVRLVQEAVTPVIVVAAPGQAVPALPPEVAIVRDEAEGRGPLQGLAAGLAALAGQAEVAYLSACDAPFLRPAFVQRLLDLLGENAICVPRVGGYHQPLAAVYRAEVLPVVRELLAANQLRPTFLFDAVPTRLVSAAELADIDPTCQSLRNLNTPEEYAAALRELQTSAAQTNQGNAD